MKINNNTKITPYIYTVYILIGILFVLFLITKFLPIRLFQKHPMYVLPIIGIILLIIIRYRGAPIFEYDSEGEAINFKNYNIALPFLYPSNKSSEFPKRKLVSYKIKSNLLKKVLEITIRSKKSSTGYSKLKYSISYLSGKEVRGIKKSLDKILIENKTTQNEAIQ